jgi:peptide/nickel transport system permease protein
VIGYLLRRLRQSVLVVLGVLVTVFVILHLTGDPALLLMPPGSSEQDLAVARHKYGLDKPLYAQLIRFFIGDRLSPPDPQASTVNVTGYGGGAVQHKLRRVQGALFGDFGDSIRFTDQPAMPIVLERFPLTLQLMVAAAAYSTVLSLILGTVSALRPYSAVDQAVRTFAVLNQSIPNFWLALLLILVFAVSLGALPAMGYGDWRNVVLPAITLGSQSLGRNTRLVRSSVLGVLSQDYVRTARAKGLPARFVVAKHVLKNAMIPVTTIWGLDIGVLFGGAVITESIFGWPGTGRLIVESVTFRDFPTVEAAVFFIALVFIVINTVVDLSYVWLDPRVRLD